MKVFDLANNLVRLGHRVVLFAPRVGSPRRQTAAEVVEVPVPDVWGVRQLVFQFVLFWAACYRGVCDKPDLIYVRIMPSPIPLLLAKLWGLPLCLEVNDDPYGETAPAGMTGGVGAIGRWINRWYFRLSDHVFPATHGIGRKLCRYGGTRADRITVLSSGANVALCRPLVKEDCRRTLTLAPAVSHVGFLGTLFRHQGVHVLVESAPLILARFPMTRFLVVGDGPMRTSLEEQVRRIGLSDSFIFTGHVAYELVPLYVGSMDLCVAPFTADRGETSPVKLFDTLACGRPVIAGDIDAVRQVFEGPRCGVVFVPPDQPQALATAVQELLSDRQRTADLGVAGRQFVVTQHDRTRVAHTVIDVCPARHKGSPTQAAI